MLSIFFAKNASQALKLTALDRMLVLEERLLGCCLLRFMQIILVHVLKTAISLA